MPQFGGFAFYSERRVKSFVAIVAVVDEIEVAIGELTVDEKNTGIGFGLRVLEVGRDVEGLEHVG